MRSLHGTNRLLSLIVAATMISGCRFQSERSYQGEGRMTVLHRVPATAIKIDFDKFRMNLPSQHRYRIAGLPHSNYTYHVGLAVDQAIDYFYQSPDDW